MAYRKTGTWDSSGTLVGPYKDRKIGNRNPESDTLEGPAENLKKVTWDPKKLKKLFQGLNSNQKSGTQYLNETLILLVGAY